MNWVQAKIAAEAHLEPGENLRWFGTPSTLAFAASRVPAALLGLCICAGAVFWMSRVYNGTDPIARLLAKTPIYLVLKNSLSLQTGWYIALAATLFLLGLGLLRIVPFVLAAVEARATVYAVTDRRVFVLTEPRWPLVRSWHLDSLMIDVTERRGGRGDLKFLNSPKVEAPGIHDYDFWPEGFFGVQSVREVEGLISELRRAAKNSVNLPA